MTPDATSFGEKLSKSEAIHQVFVSELMWEERKIKSQCEVRFFINWKFGRERGAILECLAPTEALLLTGKSNPKKDGG